MSDYVKSTNFASKDALAAGNPLKIVKGTEIDTEFNNIATAVATKADLNSPTFIGTPAAPTASAGTNTTQVSTTAFVKTAIDNYDAALTVSTSRIENSAVTTAKIADAAVTNAKLANGAATGAKLGSDVVVTSGDQTIGGTKTFSNGVRFNDGTTQTTAPFSAPSAGTFYTVNSSAFLYAQKSVANNWVLSQSRFIVMRSGSVRVRLGYGGAYDSGPYGTAYISGTYRIYINGGAVGSQVSTTSSNQLFITQDFSVNAGDVFQIGGFAAQNGWAFNAGMFPGVSDLTALPAIAIAYVY